MPCPSPSDGVHSSPNVHLRQAARHRDRAARTALQLLAAALRWVARSLRPKLVESMSGSLQPMAQLLVIEQSWADQCYATFTEDPSQSEPQGPRVSRPGVPGRPKPHRPALRSPGRAT